MVIDKMSASIQCFNTAYWTSVLLMATQLGCKLSCT